jgi:hypothetical protein
MAGTDSGARPLPVYSASERPGGGAWPSMVFSPGYPGLDAVIKIAEQRHILSYWVILGHVVTQIFG